MSAIYKKIMVPLDGSNLAECVLPYVEAVLKGADSPEVLFVQAIEPITIPLGRGISGVTSMERLKELESHNRAEAEEYLKEAVTRFKEAGVNARADVIEGKAAEALSDYAIKNNVDLIIVATHGRSGVSRWVWGSVAERLIRSSNAPVLVVRPPGCEQGI